MNTPVANATTSVSVGANININTSTIFVGNSTVNTVATGGQITISGTTVNSTIYTGTANNANNLGTLSLATIQGQITGNAATAYSNAVTFASNASNITTGELPNARLSSAVVNTSGNFTVAGNINFTAANVNFTTVRSGANVSVNTTTLFIGNSTQNSTITATGATLTGLATLNGGMNTTTANASTQVNVGANVSINTSMLAVSNSTTTANLTAAGLRVGNTTANNTDLRADVGVFKDLTVDGTFTVAATLEADGSIIPGTSDAFTLGNTTNKFSELHASRVITSNVSSTESVTVGNSSINAAITSTSIFIGNSTVSATVNSTAFSGRSNTANTLATSRNFSITGSDVTASALSFDGSQNIALAAALTATGVSAGQYTKVTVDTKGRVTSGTFISASDVTTALTGTLSLGNSTVNTVITNTSIRTGNSTVNTSITSTGIDTDGTLAVLNAATLSNTLAVTGVTTLSNTLAVTGVTTLSNTLAVTGVTTLSNTLAVTGTATLSNTLTVTGLTALNGALNTTTANASIAVNIGANASLNTTALYIGNSTVNTVITSSSINTDGTLAVLNTATLSNTLTVTGLTTLNGGMNTTIANASAAVNVGANAALNTSTLRIGNSTVNTVITSTGIDTDGTLAVLNAATLSNTLAVTGATTLSNTLTVTGLSTLNGGMNTTTANASVAVNVGANSVVNTTTFFVGNSAVNTNITAGQVSISGATVNSTIYTGTANNANNLGGVSATGYARLSGATFTGAVVVSNTLSVSNNVTITGNLIVTGTTIYANVNNLDVKDLNITVAKSVATAALANGAGLTVDTANVTWVYNNPTNSWQSNVNITPASNNTLSLGNSGLVWSNVHANNIQSTNLFGTLQTTSQPNITANNSTNFGGLSLATVQGQITGNASTAYTNAIAIAANATNLSSGTVNASRLSGTYTINVTGTASNATNLNSQPGSFYTNATNISTGTLATARLPATANIATAVNIGANVNLTTSIINVGNSTVNVSINSTSIAVSNTFTVGSAAVFVANGNVGLGTSSPAAKFDLVGDYKEGVVTANTSTAYTVNLAAGTVQNLTLTGSCTFTFPAATPAGRSFLMFLRQDATGNRTVTWPGTLKWPGNTAPTLTSTASQTDMFAFTADGTSWFGRVIAQNYS